MNKYQKQAEKLAYIITKDYYGVKQVVSDKSKIAKYLMLEEKGPQSPKGGLMAKRIIGKRKLSKK